MAAYVVGVAETPLGRVENMSELAMVAVAARDALAEAGLTLLDVDGIFTTYMGPEPSLQLGEYLGVRPRYAECSDLGGGAFEVFAAHAADAIAAGRIDVALIGYASRQRSLRKRRPAVEADHSLLGQFEAPYGLPMPIGNYALFTAAYLHKYGLDRTGMAHVAVAARQWAQRNPKAWSRDPLSVEDVLTAAPLCDPLSRHDCCLRTDGGGVVVMASEAVARGSQMPPVRLLGAGEAHGERLLAQIPDLDDRPGRRSSREALGQAGLVPSDIDVFEPYDAFTSMVLMHLEDVGFCGPGEASELACSGALAPGGAHPSMTSGGGLSYNHPGALGLLLLIEAVRQLRGEAGDRQVPDARTALVHAPGGRSFSMTSTLVLGRE